MDSFCVLCPYRYAGMLKSHKQNLVPESEFHIREERVKAQKTDGDVTATKPLASALPPTAAATEKQKKEEKETLKEKEERVAVTVSQEERPQKIAKIKGAATAAEAKAAALAEKEKQQQPKQKEKETEKGEDSKISETTSEAVDEADVAVSTPNPESSAVATARRETKAGNDVGPVKRPKTAEKTGKVAENGGSNHRPSTKTAEIPAAKEEEGGADVSGKKGGRDGGGTERKPGSKETSSSVKANEKTPKSKPKTLTDKSEGTATPGSKVGTPMAALSPATRGAKVTQNSPVVSQNGPTPSPSRAGQRRPLSETEVTEVISEKGMFQPVIHVPLQNLNLYTKYTRDTKPMLCSSVLAILSYYAFSDVWY